ncbi:hypothetical protein C0991_000625 [Blastosporella zonata]|nr:hypothetical protein C0991_000625 [Blastosporella zonata]
MLINGTQVLISRIDPVAEDQSVLRGSVVSSSSSQLKVAFPEMFDEVGEGEWRLDIGQSSLIYERLREAVLSLQHDPNVYERASHANPQPIMVGTHLRDVLLRTFQPSAEESVVHHGLQGADEVAYLSRDELEHPCKGAAEGAQFGAFKDDMRIQSWARRYAQQDPIIVEGDPVIDGLNVTQLRAVASMVGQRISLIQGVRYFFIEFASLSHPYYAIFSAAWNGEDKNYYRNGQIAQGTALRGLCIGTAFEHQLQVHFEVPHPILVCTYTNVAVDNLVEGLAQSGVKPLRVGSGTGVRSSVAQYTLDYKLSIHPLAPELQRLLKEIEGRYCEVEDLKQRLKDTERQTGQRAQQKADNMKRALLVKEANLGAIKGKQYAIRQEMLKDVLGDADVICTTCITSACMALKVTDFPVVFLDEASMSTEPASLIPIMKGSRHVALIGDHKQLPPVITSPDALALGLGLSLFERLTDEGVVPSVMLDTQYRMHPAISRFPSSEFYDHALQDGTVDASGNAHARLSPPTSQHLRGDEVGNRPSVVFVDHSGKESKKERSYANHSEAHIVMSIVEDLLLHNPQLMGRDIGIIAPYVAQISLLTRMFNRDATYRQRLRDVLGDHRAMQLANVEIKTVDGFEGREKDVIIFSTVRNNLGGYIGFLADRRRLNVGLTRARRGLFVVGNLTTLESGKRLGGESQSEAVSDNAAPKPRNKKGKDKGAGSWRRYAKYLVKHGLVVKLEGDALGEALHGNFKAAKKALEVAA